MAARGDPIYGEVRQVSASTLIPAGHSWLRRSHHTIATSGYARLMNLARGRILYEVYDYYLNEFIGHIVPNEVYYEAVMHPRSDTTADWDGLPTHKRNLHRNTHRSILELFPRIPEMVAKVVTERMVEHGRNLDKEHVEQNVVNHIRHCWTTYEFLMEKGMKKPEARESVKGRMRDVLEQWLPAERTDVELGKIWRRYELLDERKGDVEEGEGNGRNAMRLMYFAGAETPANLVANQPSW